MAPKKRKHMNIGKKRHIMIGASIGVIGLLSIGFIIQSYPNLVKTQTAPSGMDVLNTSGNIGAVLPTYNQPTGSSILGARPAPVQNPVAPAKPHAVCPPTNNETILQRAKMELKLNPNATLPDQQQITADTNSGAAPYPLGALSSNQQVPAIRNMTDVNGVIQPHYVVGAASYSCLSGGVVTRMTFNLWQLASFVGPI